MGGVESHKTQRGSEQGAAIFSTRPRCRSRSSLKIGRVTVLIDGHDGGGVLMPFKVLGWPEMPQVMHRLPRTLTGHATIAVQRQIFESPRHRAGRTDGRPWPGQRPTSLSCSFSPRCPCSRSIARLREAWSTGCPRSSRPSFSAAVGHCWAASSGRWSLRMPVMGGLAAERLSPPEFPGSACPTDERRYPPLGPVSARRGWLSWRAAVGPAHAPEEAAVAVRDLWHQQTQRRPRRTSSPGEDSMPGAAFSSAASR